jgi:dipeptidyl aminopeptidase/acylaminoacyl peptidase
MRRGRLRAGSLAAIALLPFVMSSAASSDVPAPIDPRVALGPGYELVSQNSRGVPAHGDSWPVAISGDGRSVLFSSDAANLPGPDLGRRQLYVRDLDTGRTELVSRNDAGEPALADAEGFGISTDGRYVLFGTGADNFPSTDLGRQLFLRDRITRSTLMVGRGTGGAPLPDVWAASMSANGRRIAFKDGASRSTDQIYFRNLRTGRTRLLTRSDEDGAPVDDTEASAPGFPEISGNGRYVVFETASYEAFGNGGEPCQFCPYIHDLKTRTTTVITDGVTSSGPEWPEGVDISPNGRVVIWRSYSARVYDRDTDTHEPFSTSIHGTDDWVLSFSRTGRFIAFGAFAGPDAGEVYVHDRVAGVDVAVVREVAPVSCFSSTHAIDRSGSLVAFGCTLYSDPQHEVVAEGHVYVRDVAIGS